MYETMSFLIFVTLSFLCVVRGKLTEVIQTDKGPVQGEIVQTVQNSSIEYSSFRAIPFAKPPIGVLRFQPPVEADVWLETLNATSDAPPCPQINFEDIYVGVEDCLYLNVYSPKTSFENGEDKELLAVMVWLYGGEFLFGDITKTRFGPDFVIVENVIIVNINYRLGALGFLSLNTATGNMGLKDQVLALKWVQKNIDKFGGDPKKVTIFGQSAGAVSAMLHQISPASKGLFRAVIAMSGSPLERWAFNPMSLEVEQGLDVAKRLELTNDSKYQLLQEYKNKSAEELVHGVKNGFTKGGISLLHFTPTVENSSIAKDIFLSECPLKNYQSGNFTDLPVILGFMGSETLFFTRIFRGLFRLINTVDTFIRQTFESINSPIFKILYWIIKINEKLWIYMIHTVFYTSIKITTDVIFVAGIDSTQKYLVQSSSSPIYYYRNSFDYEHSYHRTLGIDLDGAAHVDDVYEIFYQSNRTYLLDPESRINTQIKRMVKLWTNFAKYLDPTPDGKADPLLNVTWSPSGSEGLHLEIGNEKLTMGPRPASFIVWLVQLLSKPIESFVAGC